MNILKKYNFLTVLPIFLKKWQMNNIFEKTKEWEKKMPKNYKQCTHTGMFHTYRTRSWESRSISITCGGPSLAFSWEKRQRKWIAARGSGSSRNTRQLVWSQSSAINRRAPFNVTSTDVNTKGTVVLLTSSLATLPPFFLRFDGGASFGDVRRELKSNLSQMQVALSCYKDFNFFNF